MKKETIKIPKYGTKRFIKWFENEQKQFGTEVAVNNLLWDVGADIMYKAGVKNIKTTYK